MKLPTFLPIALLLAAALPTHGAEPSVQVISHDGKFELHRNGSAYLIRGAGAGLDMMESLAQAGGNSTRTWADGNLDAVLDRAQKLGLTVTAGIWLGQVRQGFDWKNESSLQKQRDHVRAVVEKYKDHPALLTWALGNEMEDREGKNTAVWTEINRLARMVKEIDPNHPTMTVIAEIGADKVKNFHSLCPDVDILGINAYGGGASVAERYRKAGGTKPFILTEYGPNGIWETAKNNIGAYAEPTSTAKAEAYRRAYRGTVLGGSGLCLGSYAFVWGQKQEVTSTWFSMLLKDGTRLGAVDAVSELWTGKPPANRVPEIKSLTLEGPSLAKPSATISAKLEASDPENDPLTVTWQCVLDTGEYGTGGDREEAPLSFPDAIVKSDSQSATIRLPASGGLFRIFATARDGHGGGAVANVPVRVEGRFQAPKGEPAKLPFPVYTEAGEPSHYIASGLMGDRQSIKLDPACSTQPHAGKTCLRCEFSAKTGWAGVAWQSPANDWGNQPGGYDLTGARKLTFWARGENGGEVANFEFGTIKPPKLFCDTAGGKLSRLTLTKDWQSYEIDVSGQDLSRIKTGFVWTLSSSGQPVVFYLDDIRWE